MFLQELNSIRKTQFDLENLIKQRARSTPSFLSEIKLLFETITHGVLQLQSSMLKQFKMLEIQVSTFGAFLSNKLEISQKLSDLSAFQAQFNIILEIQADLEIQLRKKKWYKNTIDLVVRIFPSFNQQSNSVIQNSVLFSEKSVRKPKRKIEKEKSIILPRNIPKSNSLEIEQTRSDYPNEINQTFPKKRIEEILLSSPKRNPVPIDEPLLLTNESSLPQSVSMSQDTILNTQDNYVNKSISSDTILDKLFSQETCKTMDLSQTLPISSLSINQTQTQENFSSLLFDCTDIFPNKEDHGSLMNSQATTIAGNSPILGQKYKNTSLLTHDNVMLTQDNIMLTQDSVMLTQDSVMLTQDNVMLTQDSVMLTQDSVMLYQQNQPFSQSQEISQYDQTWHNIGSTNIGNLNNETAEYTNIDSVSDSITIPRETNTGNVSNDKISCVSDSTFKLVSSEKGSKNIKHASQYNNTNSNHFESGYKRILAKQVKPSTQILEKQQREIFEKPMISKQDKKNTDIQKLPSSQPPGNFTFPTKQKSILNYVSPPRNQTINWEIANRVENDLFKETQIQTNQPTNLSNFKNSRKLIDKPSNKNSTNSRKLNSRSFYKMNFLMISREEITMDFPESLWTSETIPDEVMAQLELDLNFW